MEFYQIKIHTDYNLVCLKSVILLSGFSAIILRPDYHIYCHISKRVTGAENTELL